MEMESGTFFENLDREFINIDHVADEIFYYKVLYLLHLSLSLSLSLSENLSILII
jgi:hypothetical protein